MPKLTKRTIDTLKPNEEKRVFVWDDKLSGFGLKITANAKTYVLQYRTTLGRSRRYTIGRHGDPWTCEQARELAENLLHKIKRDGFDPLEEKAEARESLTIKELADLYESDGPAVKTNKKASSWETDKSNIKRHIVPLLGRRFARTLTRADVAKFQRDVAEGKTACSIKTKPRGKAIVKGGKGVASRTLAVLGAMLEFGVQQKLIPHNPAKKVPLSEVEECGFEVRASTHSNSEDSV